MGIIKINNKIYGGSSVTASNILYNGGVSGLEASTVQAAIDKVSEKIEDTKSEVEELIYSNLINFIYPIGSIYMSVNNVSPASFLGGTWEAIQDRFLLAAGSSYSAGSIGGAATVTLTENEIPSHEGHLASNDTNSGGNTARYLNQTVLTAYGSAGRGWNVQSSNEIAPAGHSKGGSQAHNNMPPYLTVYMWKRIG